MELAAEMVAAFVSNNPLPKGELPALISAVHTAAAKLAAGPESAPPPIEAKAPAGVDKAGAPITRILIVVGLSI
jgi:predicted transcriptional regulator